MGEGIFYAEFCGLVRMADVIFLVILGKRRNIVGINEVGEYFNQFEVYLSDDERSRSLAFGHGAILCPVRPDARLFLVVCRVNIRLRCLFWYHF